MTTQEISQRLVESIERNLITDVKIYKKMLSFNVAGVLVIMTESGKVSARFDLPMTKEDVLYTYYKIKNVNN